MYEEGIRELARNGFLDTLRRPRSQAHDSSSDTLVSR
jgi:hypothetical protein